jgi:hypothetical protein
MNMAYFKIHFIQGAEIYEKIRPVDVLMELLRDCSGPDNEIIKNYFNLQGADQACATALIIACNHNNNNVQVKYELCISTIAYQSCESSKN